jgi:ATP-dependent DNA helicase RecG
VVRKLITEAFYLTAEIEKYGSGFIRMRKALLNYPELSFSFEESGDGFLIELRKTTPKTTLKTTPKIPLSEKILVLLKENPGLTKNEVAQNLEISVNTVKQYISKLKKEGLVERIGGSKNGYWQVKEN